MPRSPPGLTGSTGGIGGYLAYRAPNSLSRCNLYGAVLSSTFGAEGAQDGDPTRRDLSRREILKMSAALAG